MPMPYLKLKPKSVKQRKKLLKASFGFSTPFSLNLAHHDQLLFCEEVVRIIPKKRLVVFGRWNNQPIVAKLFFSRQAKQHLERELKGVNALIHAKIPSPALLHSDSTSDHSVQILIFEHLQN